MKRVSLMAAAIASLAIVSVQAEDISQIPWPGGDNGINSSTGNASAEMEVHTELVDMIAIKRFRTDVAIDASTYTPGATHYTRRTNFAVTRTGGGIGTNHSRPFDLTISSNANLGLWGGYALANDDGAKIPLEIVVNDEPMSPNSPQEFQTNLGMNDWLGRENMSVDLKIPVEHALAATAGTYLDVLTFKVAAK